jgi:hypothetical protein
MRKMKLELDRLEVESFAPSRERNEGGTVHAHSFDTCYVPCPDPSAEGSCFEVSCQQTCGQAASCGYNPCGTFWPGCRGYITNYPDACVPQTR